MLFHETKLGGAYVIEVERREDPRGFFGRSWCVEEFVTHGLNSHLVQCNISYNLRKGTLRGMHYQIDPYPETKLVRCTMGGIYDVIIDLRPSSPTYTHHFGVELTAENRSSLYIPVGFAHGFQTLTDDTEVFYQMSEFYHPECAAGVLWNDPAFGIQWPLPNPLLSDRDCAYPNFLSTETPAIA